MDDEDKKPEWFWYVSMFVGAFGVTIAFILLWKVATGTSKEVLEWFF
ncbi:hypothetical protein G3M81_22820 [Bacillus paralicheniformis]|jgi:hypothetical protein|nr:MULTISPECIES: hypothetical protein [Bacillus]QII26926.1 hypothetical protein G3M80_20730 [Bacillus altitudinis]QII51394.1 hypothetical protein G3M81_22820 [Bacillus paralicheniformis]